MKMIKALVCVVGLSIGFQAHAAYRQNFMKTYRPIAERAGYTTYCGQQLLLSALHSKPTAVGEFATAFALVTYMAGLAAQGVKTAIACADVTGDAPGRASLLERADEFRDLKHPYRNALKQTAKLTGVCATGLAACVVGSAL